MKLKLFFRRLLKKPLGNLVSESRALALARKSSFFVSVGDVTALLFLSRGLRPNLAIVDLRVRRKPLHARGVKALRKAKATKLFCSNPRGTISLGAINKIASAFKLCATGKKVILFVRGEEDLLFLPAVLAAPAGALLFYGQPGKGVVVLKASLKEKKRIGELLYSGFID